jgi:hypothetical protein
MTSPGGNPPRRSPEQGAQHGGLAPGTDENRLLALHRPHGMHNIGALAQQAMQLVIDSVNSRAQFGQCRQ